MRRALRAVAAVWRDCRDTGQPLYCRLLGHAPVVHYDPARGRYFSCAQRGCHWESPREAQRQVAA